MARSRRMAGGCSAPTDGNLPSGHSRLSTAISFACFADARPCAPRRHRPTGRAASLAGRHLRLQIASRPSSVTTRGHGRCPSTLCLAMIIGQCSACGFTLSEQLRRRSGTRRRAPAACRCRRRAPARDARTSARRRPAPCPLAPRGSPKAMLLRRRNSAPMPTRMPNTSMIASSGSRAKVELTTRNSLMKMPSGGRPAMATTPSTRPQPSTGCGIGQPAHIGDALRAFYLRDMANREEDRRLGQRVHGHVQQPGEVGERPAHAEGKSDDAHMLDRGIGEQALDVAAPVQHERREDEREQPHRHHQRTGRKRVRVHREQHLETQQSVKRDIEKEPRQHRRDRRRALGMRVRQPGMQRGEANLRAVAEAAETRRRR